MASFEASGTIPVFHVDAKGQTGVSIGTTLGKAFKKQFPEIEKTYDTYLASFVDQRQFNEWVEKRVNVIKPNIDPAYRDEVNAIASTSIGAMLTRFGWHLIQLDNIRTAALPPFKSVKDRIRAALQLQQMQTYVDELKKQAKIEISVTLSPKKE